MKQIVRMTIHVPALVFLPALHQVHMSHNMLSGVDLLTRLQGTLLPEKRSKTFTNPSSHVKGKIQSYFVGVHLAIHTE